MGTTTFSGPIKAGTVREGSSANTGSVILAQTGTVVFGADGTETVIATIPANSVIVDVIVDVTTAFDAATTNTFDIGDGTTVNEFADALDVSSVARVLASSDVSQLGNYTVSTSDVDVTVTYNQSGTAATAGAASTIVQYVQV